MNESPLDPAPTTRIKTRKSTKPGQTDPMSKPRQSAIRKKNWGTIPTEIAITVALVAVTAVATFFSTRASLEGRIASLEARVSKDSAVDNYLRRANIHLQINYLQLLDGELEALSRFLDGWSPPEFTYGKTFPGAPKNAAPLPYEIVTGRSDGKPMPSAIDAYPLVPILENTELRAIPNSALVTDIASLARNIRRYNSAVIDASSRPFGGRDVMMGGIEQLPKVDVGTSREKAEEFKKSATESILLIREDAKDLRSRLGEVRRKIEGVLPQENYK